MLKANVFLFPGQGSQSVGMLRDIASNYPETGSYFDRASVVLGYDLWALTQEGPEQQLNRTEVTQPALLVASYALFQLLQKHAPKHICAMAGHSLGEYTALVCANAISLEDGVRLVQQRGQAMQSAVPDGQGAMAAIVGLTADAVTELCQQASIDEQVVIPANFNGERQIVISGSLSAVDRAMVLAKTQGAKLIKRLPMSVPSHSPLMRLAADDFEPHLNMCSMNMPQVTLISNVTAEPYQSVADIKRQLLQQLYSSVLWVDVVRYAATQCTTMLECGPGRVLSGLVKRIDRSLTTIGAEDHLLDIQGGAS